MHIKCAMTLVT